MKCPLISIVLPTYNGERFISKTIESCLSQTYSNLELIIVNDASTDDTRQIINTYQTKDSRVKVITNRMNMKLPASLNIGFSNADGELYSWISDDNYFYNTAMEQLFDKLTASNADIVCSDYNMIDDRGSVMGEGVTGDFHNFLLKNPVGASFLYKKDVYLRNKGFDEELFLLEDYHFWLKSLTHSKIVHLNEKLCFYRFHESSLTSQMGRGEHDRVLFDKCRKLNKKILNSFGFSDDDIPWELLDIFASVQLMKKVSEKPISKRHANKLISDFFKQLTHDPFDFQSTQSLILKLYRKINDKNSEACCQ